MSNRQLSSRSIRLGVRLLAASSVVAGSMVLQGCDKSPDTSAVYADAEACTADKMFTPEFCESSFQRAKEEHTRLAPHYATKADCEKDWNDGECDQQPDNQPYVTGGHGGGYVPRMNGYWVGTTGSSSGAAERFAYPTYKASNGETYVPHTNQEFESYGRLSTTPDVAAAHEFSSSPRTSFRAGESFSTGASRGGFGATGRAFSGFGLGE